MSAELEKVFNAFAIGQVPAAWMGKSFPSLKPLASYVKDLLARLALFEGWYQGGQPSIFWISGFFFTPSFTTAALQNFARGNKYAIDTVGYEMEMLNMDPAEYTVAPETGIYIHGLFLEGCAWDKDKKVLCGVPTEGAIRARAVHLAQADAAEGHERVQALSVPGVPHGGAEGRARDHWTLHQLFDDDEDADGRGPGSLDHARGVHALLALRLIGREIVREDDENIALIATHIAFVIKPRGCKKTRRRCRRASDPAHRIENGVVQKILPTQRNRQATSNVVANFAREGSADTKRRSDPRHM